MRLRSLLLVGLALSISLNHEEPAHSTEMPAAPSKDQPEVRFTRDIVPFLKKHCYACHGNGKKTGELTFEAYADAAAVQKNRKVWGTVLQLLRDGEMPPKEKPRPSADEIEAVLKSIEAVLAR